MEPEVQLKTSASMCAHSMNDEELLEKLRALEEKANDAIVMAKQINRELNIATSIMTHEDTFRALNNVSILTKRYLDKYGIQ